MRRELEWVREGSRATQLKIGGRTRTAAEIGGAYIGVRPKFVRGVAKQNRPHLEALDNQEAMDCLFGLMRSLGTWPSAADHGDLKYLREAPLAARGALTGATPDVGWGPVPIAPGLLLQSARHRLA